MLTAGVLSLLTLATELEAILAAGKVPWREFETWRGKKGGQKPAKKG